MVLKSLDFFRKIRTEQQLELSSATGGFFTIGSFIVAGILVFLSIQDFTSTQYTTSLQVRNDPTEYIPMKIDITFNKAPCELITIRFHDELEFMETGLERKLQMFVVEGGSESPYVRTEDRGQIRDRAQESVEKQKKCRIEGVLNLPKTPGTLTFEMNGPDNVILEMEGHKRQWIRASYYLKKLEFGEALKPFELPVTHSSQVVEQYIKKLEGDFATRSYIQDFQGRDQRLNFYNHLKIIPIFVDDGTYKEEKDKQKYRYSLRAGSAMTMGFSPMLEIYTEIEPINIVYTRSKMSFYDLCVDILAIAGGSVATIGVVNSLYHYLFSFKP